jgi:hypothetical protein
MDSTSLDGWCALVSPPTSPNNKQNQKYHLYLLLIKDNARHIRKIPLRNNFQKFTRHNMSRNSNDASVILKSHHGKRPISTECKLARVQPSRGELLQEVESSCRCVDGEGDEGVGGYLGAVVWVWVGDLEGGFIAGGDC